MIVKVNRPPEIELPEELKKLGISVINYFEELNRYNLQMFTRTGGASDFIDEAEQNLTSTGSRVSRNAARIDGLEFIRFRVVEVVADYQAAPFEMVICNNVVPITILLEPNALIEDQIHVKRKQDAAKVTVSGNIDGKTSRVINIKNWSDFYVFGETEWAVI
jgi:hypothetical protein